jgi:predicted aspartyl protease
MVKTDDCYAITLYDNNDEKLKHVWFDVQIILRQEPETTCNLSVSKIWTVKAMIDTGATISAITSRMAARMGLKSEKEGEFSYAKGSGISPIYLFDVIFPGDKVFENIEAVEIDDDRHSDFLIGMNIISQGDMALTSVNGKAAFSFRCPPAEKYIDFEKELIQEGNNTQGKN